MPRPALALPLRTLAFSLFATAQVADVDATPLSSGASASSVVSRYCLDCHDAGIRKGDLSLENLPLTFDAIAANPALYERIARKLDHRQMPPLGEARPTEAEYSATVAFLHTELDRAAAAHSQPGRTEALRRLNRTEYRNAIRDLLALDVDTADLLPNDEPAHGFDNVTVSTLSPTLLDRYVSAAQKIARLAIGAPRKTPAGETFRVRPDVTQEEHIEGLPLGTRGGAVFSYTFPQDGDYEIQIRLARDRNEQVEGLRRPHEVEALLDGERLGLFTVKPPGADKNAELVDAHLRLRVPVKSGPHTLGVTFLKNPSTLIETERQPFLARYNMHRHPRTVPALYQVSITGPFNAKGPGDTPSRRKVFAPLGASAVPLSTASTSANDQTARAREILRPLLRQAYRRPVTDEDLQRPLEFFREGSAEGAGFEAGIEEALAAILVSPQFLFRVETDPKDIAPGTAYRITSLELASRLSFFLWSSLPDEPLLADAAAGTLTQPAVLERQVRRMLADPRASNLVSNFAVQWLHLRKLQEIEPDLRLFPDFDDNLRQAFRRETELFVESIFRGDRPVTELLHANYTFVNERLARHYGVPYVYGSRFRRIELDGELAAQRGGLLRHGSILTVTSYATRTSPVIRGHWILANLVGSPPPPPPPNVPALDDNTVSAALPMRERLAKHRANPACASCHNIMDPVGFALENFDATGRFRLKENYQPIDAAGGLPDGSTFTGVASLERGLLQRPELFTATLTEKLLIFALGRGVEPTDAPAIRAIVRRAQADDYHFSSLILSLVQSPPFQMRKSP